MEVNSPSKAMKEGRQKAGRPDRELRIAYVGNEIGNGAYDLDRILEKKTIRYERETVAGKSLDWRANALSVISNYGDGDWDLRTPLLQKPPRVKAPLSELRSTDGWLGSLTAPENVLDRAEPERGTARANAAAWIGRHDVRTDGSEEG